MRARCWIAPRDATASKGSAAPRLAPSGPAASPVRRRSRLSTRPRADAPGRRPGFVSASFPRSWRTALSTQAAPARHDDARTGQPRAGPEARDCFLRPRRTGPRLRARRPWKPGRNCRCPGQVEAGGADVTPLVASGGFHRCTALRHDRGARTCRRRRSPDASEYDITSSSAAARGHDFLAVGFVAGGADVWPVVTGPSETDQVPRLGFRPSPRWPQASSPSAHGTFAHARSMVRRGVLAACPLAEAPAHSTVTSPSFAAASPPGGRVHVQFGPDVTCGQKKNRLRSAPASFLGFSISSSTNPP